MGWQLDIVDTAGDIDAINDAIERAVADKADAVVINVDPDLISRGMAAAANANLPVVGMDSGAHPLLVSNVTSNGFAMAAETAAYVANRIKGEGKVIMLVYDHFPPVQKRAAIADAVFANYQSIEVIERITPDITDGGVADTKAQISKILEANPEPGSISAIWAGWDQPALGALQAIEAAGRTGEGIVIVGMDGTAEALQAIQSGSNLEATITQDFQGIGHTTAAVVARVLSGKEVVEIEIYLPTRLSTRASLSED
ncbi:sugar ABC transporter substrate-binding protein [Pseudovibrio japonicus]|uniref:Sugar ABC transporter substrate-binding protein n=1 Tax=Pseudovibrio japonicus TaxID=366534 RepID=A0ABQ3DXH7_9HYPH|nr:sugar ABC transporter substrate-binding protein [Pseudovibrio japonicus]